MFIIRTESAAMFGPRVNFLIAKDAETPEEALDHMKSRLEDWALEDLAKGRIQITLFECSEAYKVKGGEIVPLRNDHGPDRDVAPLGGQMV